MRSTPPEQMKAIAGKLADAESIVALKDMFNRVGCGNTRAESVEGVSADSRSSYLFNSNIVGVEDADVILLIGSDPRSEAPVLNARLRRANVAGGTRVASVGPTRDLTYPVESLGDSARDLETLASGSVRGTPWRVSMDRQNPGSAQVHAVSSFGSALVPDVDGDGTLKSATVNCASHWLTVDDQKRAQLAGRLVNAGGFIESRLGGNAGPGGSPLPQDVEGCLTPDGALWIVQARPQP